MAGWGWPSPLRRLSAPAGIAAVLSGAMALVVALFSVVHGALFKALPFPSADRILHLEIPFERLLAQREQLVTLPGVIAGLPLLEPTFVRHRAGVDRAVVGYSSVDLRPVLVSADFFPLFGASPVIGRALTREDAGVRPRPAILSYSLWMGRYGGTAEVLNQTVDLPGPVGLPDEQVTIVGIMRERFEFPRGANVWMPYSPEESLPSPIPDYVRLAPGATVEAVQHALPGVSVVTLRSYLRPKEAWPLSLVLVNCVLLLLTAWAQAGGRTATRAWDRLGEFALRRALGATEGQLRLMVTLEVGGLAALLISVSWTLSLPLTIGLVALLPGDFSAGLDLSPGLAAFGFALMLITAGSALLLSISWGAIRAAQVTTLVSPSAVTRTPRNRRLQTTLFAALVGLITTLMVLAGAAFKSLEEAQRINLGFDPKGLFAFVLPLPAGDPAAERINRQRVRQSLEAARRLTGARRASLAGAWPLADAAVRRLVTVGTTAPLEVRLEHIGLAYPETIGTRLVEGREALVGEASPFISGGRIDRVGLVNQTFARQLQERGPVVGQLIPLSSASTVRVVGVLADVEDNDLDGRAPPTLYLYRSDEVSGAVLMARVSEELPISVVRASLDDIWGPERRNVAVVSLDDVVARLTADARVRSRLMSLVTLICIPLTVWGIAGMVKDEISRSRRDLSIRMAIGASHRDLANNFLRRLLVLATGGVLGGGLTGVLFVWALGSLRSVATVDALLLALVGCSALTVVCLAVVFGLRSLRFVAPADLLRTPL